MSYRKLGRTSSERKAMLRGLVTDLLNYGQIETTEARAKEAKRAAEKIITKAIHVYGDTVEAQKTIKGAGTKVVNDSAKKLAVRRNIMRYLYDIPAPKQPKESKTEYKKRTKDVKNPVVEKLFREIAPKYAERAKNLGQGGGYTRIIKLGPRRGDGAEVVLLELV